MRNIKLLLAGLILLFISSVYIKEISLYQITPTILLPWVIYISIYLDYKYCLTYTFLLSLANDLLNPQLLGFNTILFVTLSHFTHKYHSSFNKDKFRSVLFSLLCVNFVFYMIQWVYFAITSREPLHLLEKSLYTIAYNTVLSVIVIIILVLVDKLKVYIHD